MTKCAFCYQNFFDTAILAASSQNPNFPAINLQHRWITKTWRSAGPVSTANIVIDFSVPKSVRAFLLFGHNFPSSVIVTIQANTTNSWDSPAVNQNAVSGGIFYWFWDSEQVYRYWRVVITDLDPSLEYFEAGRIFLGNFFEPNTNLSNAYQLTYLDPSEVIISDGGQLTSSQKTRYKKYRVQFEAITSSDKNSLVNIFSDRGKALEWIFIIDRDNLQNTFCYCRFSSDLEITHIWGEQYFDVSFSIEELR